MLRIVFALLYVSLALVVPCAAKESHVIAGAGPSTGIVQLFFRHFAEQPAAAGVEFIVPQQSIKHAGGIRHSFKHLFGRTGRPLIETEKEYHREEIILAVMPVCIATGAKVGITQLSLADLEDIFQKRITNWKQLGGPDAPIMTVGREPTEALFSELKRFYMFFRNAEFDLVLNKDHEVAELLESPKGQHAISFGARANLKHLNLIHVKEELNTGVRLGLVYDKKNEHHPLVTAVKDFAKSEEWRSLVIQTGSYPVDIP